MKWHAPVSNTGAAQNEKTGYLCIQKTKKKPSVGIELRAGWDPHRSEKPGWSASDTRQWPKQNNA